MSESAAGLPGGRAPMGWAERMLACIDERDAAVRAAYERGLRRGMAIAREHHVRVDGVRLTMMWGDAERQMEREIEEAKR